jgi:plasmid stabilization system protein ParE
VKFFIRPEARADILRQYRYYLSEADDELVAAKFVDAVQSAIAQVCRHPGIGAPKILKNLRLAGLRSWPVRGFSEVRVYYLALEKMIRIVRVLHGKRDIGRILDVE